jgi:hypothetical protein
LAAGHITLIYAVTWTPWLIIADDWGMKKEEKGGRWFMPGIILGLISLADIRWFPIAGFLWIAYSFFKNDITSDTYVKFAIKDFIRNLKIGNISRTVLQQLRKIIPQILLSLCISAPLLLSLLQFSNLSTRANLTPGESFAFSLPPIKLLGLFFPDIGGFAEWVLYPGVVALTLSVFLLISIRFTKRCWFWLGAGMIPIFFSLGSYIPFLSSLALIPGFDLLRVPPRILFILGLAMAVIAANGFDTILGNEPKLRSFKWVNPDILLVGLSFFSVLFAIGVSVITHSFSVNFIWGAGGICLASLLVLLKLHYKIATKVFVISVISLCLIDVGAINYLSIKPKISHQVFSEGEEIATFLSQDKGLYRVFSPSYSLPQQTAARFSLQLADGVDPLQLNSYVSFMEHATGIPTSGYSVTMPPFTSGNPATDNKTYIPDAQQLGILNVKYVIAGYDIQANGLVLIARFDDSRIYENLYALPRAWLQAATSPLGSDIRYINTLVWDPDKIQINAQGPGLLVLSEVMYPGWQVRVDGQLERIQTVGNLLRGVELTDGLHKVEFIFHPWVTYLGISIAGMTWAVLIFGIAFSGKRINKRKNPA